MLKAFDLLLQTEVTAKNAAINGDNEAFRYECICCGEEVFLAAQDSNLKATHFRHRSGNNDKECELYLGQYGAIPNSARRRNKQDHIEFYYNNSTKCFYVGLTYSDDEITIYEDAGAFLEIREKRTAAPFFKKSINHQSFVNCVPEKFSIDRYASSYFISNTLNDIKREYTVFSPNYPSFFKILSNSCEEKDFSARLIKSKSLYTNTRYFIAWAGRNTAQVILQALPGVVIEDSYYFKTFGGFTIYGIIVHFERKTPSLDNALQEWGFDLDISESVSLLWPPAYEENERSVVSSSIVYLYSTFKFQGLGNVNTKDQYITEVSEKVTKIAINEPVRILKKNAELTIWKEPFVADIQPIQIIQEYADRFQVPIKTGNSFYSFSVFGAELLKPGQVVFLTSDSFIAEYKRNSLLRTVSFSTPDHPSIESRFFEALSNYWISEDFDDSIIQSVPQPIIDYLNQCKRSGRINKAVNRLLKDEAK